MFKVSIRDLIIEILSEIQDMSDIENDTLLVEKGILDSMSILFLVNELEARLGITILLEDIVEGNFNSINQISDFLTNRLDNDSADFLQN